MKKIYLFLLFVIVFVPLGLLTQNPAWGEWENTHYKETLGFVPKGIENGFSLKALFPDLTMQLPFWEKWGATTLVLLSGYW